MRRAKEFLEFLLTLARTWKLIVPGLVLTLSVAVLLARNAYRQINLSLPAPLVVAVAALATYPLAKAIEWGFSKRRPEPFSYAGLVWVPSRLTFRDPTPACPRANCGRPVICRVSPPPAFHLVASRSDFENVRTRPSFAYECPIHGALSGVPDEDLGLLAHQAKSSQRRIA